MFDTDEPTPTCISFTWTNADNDSPHDKVTLRELSGALWAVNAAQVVIDFAKEIERVSMFLAGRTALEILDAARLRLLAQQGKIDQGLVREIFEGQEEENHPLKDFEGPKTKVVKQKRRRTNGHDKAAVKPVPAAAT
ncbi:MAG TPA: hypothetical protein VGR52_03035 [Stellaceae bacterium]|nr:hypothetical protein [Stellaceae bacterium]